MGSALSPNIHPQIPLTTLPGYTVRRSSIRYRVVPFPPEFPHQILRTQVSRIAGDFNTNATQNPQTAKAD